MGHSGEQSSNSDISEAENLHEQIALYYYKVKAQQISLLYVLSLVMVFHWNIIFLYEKLAYM